jgi:hypothetical protein
VPLPLKVPSALTGYAKPPVAVHADVAPPLPDAAAGSLDPTGAPQPVAAAPVPDGSGTGSSHDVDAGSAAGSDLPVRILDGRNLIAFGAFKDGDLVVVLDPWSVTGHAGLFDRRYYSTLYSFAVWSANVSPLNGVQREECLKYRAYDRAYGLWVPGESNHGAAARNFAASQVGKRYNIFAAKTDYRTFYCSKLVWACWRQTSGLDLDADGGFWVWPVDLVNSRHTKVFGYWN